MNPLAPLRKAFRRAHERVSHGKRLRDLTEAAKAGDALDISRLLRLGTDVAVNNHEALDYACGLGNKAAAELLLSRCGDPDFLQRSVETARRYSEYEIATLIEARLPKTRSRNSRHRPRSS